MGKTSKSKSKKQPWACPVCEKPLGSKGVFTCLGCDPPQWIHPQRGGYKNIDELKAADTLTLRCNNCKVSSFIDVF